jgi:hypothetical protein
MSRITEAPAAGSANAKRHRPNRTLIIVYLSLGGLAYAVLQSLVAPALSTCAGAAVLAVFAAIAAPSMRRRHEQALALGVSDFPDDVAE